ncbi:MAG: hypothetical protein PHS93_07700 [Candidatus Omnitrophica bacterium]|nr:hypothetical protein [Candidatus Omnitrophota bacterium]
MAKVHGKGGDVVVLLAKTSYTAGWTSWTLDDGIDTEDTTDFDDGGNSIHGFTVGLYNYTVTLEANWDAANVALYPGATALGGSNAASLTLTVTSGKTYTCKAILKSVKPKVAADGVIKATYEFIPSSALTRPS